MAVVERDLGRRADDGEHARRRRGRARRAPAVGREAREVVLLLQPGVAAHLRGRRAQPVEPRPAGSPRERRRGSPPASRACAGRGRTRSRTHTPTARRASGRRAEARGRRGRARGRTRCGRAHARSARRREPIARILPGAPGAAVRRADDLVRDRRPRRAARASGRSRAPRPGRRARAPRAADQRPEERHVRRVRHVDPDLHAPTVSCFVIRRRAYLIDADPEIRFAYGHTPACRILCRRRTAELLAGRRAARRHPARRVAPGAGAREAPRHPAARPLGPSGRADRGRPAPVPRAQRMLQLEEQMLDEVASEGAGALDRRALDRRLDRSRRRRRARAPVRVPRAASRSAGSRSRSTTPRPSSISSPTAASSSASSVRPAATGPFASSRSSRTR